jgi:hypothetical protein
MRSQKLEFSEKQQRKHDENDLKETKFKYNIYIEFYVYLYYI